MKRENDQSSREEAKKEKKIAQCWQDRNIAEIAYKLENDDDDDDGGGWWWWDIKWNCQHLRLKLRKSFADISVRMHVCYLIFQLIFVEWAREWEIVFISLCLHTSRHTFTAH